MSPQVAYQTPEQRDAALHRANDVRFAMATTKRLIRTAPTMDDALSHVAALLRDTDTLNGPVGRLRLINTLRAVRWLGTEKITRMLIRSQIFDAQRRLCDVPLRQRELLACEVEWYRDSRSR